MPMANTMATRAARDGSGFVATSAKANAACWTDT
jgi:hypothetical protein